MKEKKARKKADIPENETNNQRFHRIATGRANMLGKAYNLLTRLPRQPIYDISQDDAQKLITWVDEYHTAFLDRYVPLAKGEKKSISSEKTIKEVF